MRVHHLSCGTMCPRSRRLMLGSGGLFEPAGIVCHCLLLETEDGLTLVDAGLGMRDVENPRRIAANMRALMRPRLEPARTACAQVRALGFRPEDVQHIVMTHLDYDHAGGLADFPLARVHVFAREHAAAMRQRARLGRSRYRPSHWSHRPRWVLYEDPAGERWMDFDRVRPLEGLGDVLLVPLLGHTPGHCGVAVQTRHWLLHAGDAYFFHGEIDPAGPHCPPGLAVYEALMQTDGRARRRNRDRLRELVGRRGTDVDVFCAHDPFELERMTARPEVTPIRPVERAARRIRPSA